MDKRQRKTSWFATLRSDGRLFALLATLLLALQMLQPLAAARASEAAGHLVICTALGSEPAEDGTPTWHRGCALCIAGACGLSVPAQPVTDWAAAFEPAAAQAGPHWIWAEPQPLASSYAERPPGIRAPPFTA